MFPDPLPKHAVMLQGPNGPFFKRYARDLEALGVRITKFNFQPGDALFFGGADAIAYRGEMSEWPEVFRDFANREEVDGVILFGDCRPVHVASRQVAAELGIPVWVFEEGYIRPNFITLEQGGVNGNSPMPKDPNFYRRVAANLPEIEDERYVGPIFWWSALWTILNACSSTFFGWRYPHYTHHRDINAVRQAALWVRGGYRKYAYRLRERGVIERLSNELSGRYFLVPLQVYCDSQVTHTEFQSVDDFIRHVVATFAEAAASDQILVFKHHPHDRPYSDYRRLLRDLGREFGVGDRIIYVHDLHLPTLLRHAVGTVVMNSTVGLMSLHYDTPVKALGDAVYDIPELTCQAPLAEFLRNPGAVDRDLYEAFRRYVRYATQVNGSFHKRLEATGTASGMVRGQLAVALEAPGTDLLDRKTV